MTVQEIHNRDLAGIIKSIIVPTLNANGEFSDVLVLLESVVTGVMLFAVKTGGDEYVLDMLVDHVKKRLADQRLKNSAPAGSA